MELLAAMNEMADAMNAVNASRRQVSGVAAWHDQVTAAVAAGQQAAAAAREAGGVPVTPGPEGNVTVPGSATHTLWLITAGAIIAALDAQARTAEVLAAQAAARASRARSTARQARQAEDLARACAAACSDPVQAAAYGAEAAAAAEQAAAAGQEARQAELLAVLWTGWQIACGDAAARGRALTGREDVIHHPVREAVAAAGGLAWIARDKHFHAGGA